MSDRPVNFKAPEIRAALAGRKTQHRIVLKYAPLSAEWFCDRTETGWRWVAAGGAPSMPVRLPYAPGQRLWVREAFAPILDKAIYRADGDRQPGACCGCAWRSSIHMPRALSRITLTVTRVRVERLQDISEADAIAEGAFEIGAVRLEDHMATGEPAGTARAKYAVLWNWLNGLGAWALNPWVAAISFTVSPRNI